MYIEKVRLTINIQTMPLENVLSLSNKNALVPPLNKSEIFLQPK